MWEQTVAELAADPEYALLLGRTLDTDEDPVPAPDPAGGPEPSWWAAADVAVDEATAACAGLHQATARARRAVQVAERADLADRDAWDESAAARISAAGDALTVLGHATADQRAALADLLERSGGGGLVDRPRIASPTPSPAPCSR